MSSAKPIYIRPMMFKELEAIRPEVFAETTTWVNYLIRLGLNHHLGLDPCDKLGKPTDKERKKEEKEVLPSTYIIDNKNKEKIKKWKFSDDQIATELSFCKFLVTRFWTVKSGSKSKEAFNLLNGEKGLVGIYRKYGMSIVQEQLETAIANQWQSITLKNYEAYGRPKIDSKEPVANHPAGRVFKDGRFIDE